jgi:hypothetical protein
MELWKETPHVRVTMRYDRISNEAPEIFYSAFDMPCQGELPTLSCGGSEFTPFTDQIPGTARDYFGIDGWAKYATADGEWLWVSRDAPLVCFDAPQVWTRTQTPPQRGDRILAMIYNNTWYTNFLANQPGAVEFQFDLIWKPAIKKPHAWANTLSSNPVVVINGDGQEDPIVLNRLFKP